VFRKLYYLIGIAAVAWGWHHVRQMQQTALGEGESSPAPAALAVEKIEGADSLYRCDGRLQCREMHSCEEATWFLKHCPGVTVDGDGDGVPCEEQFCGTR